MPEPSPSPRIPSQGTLTDLPVFGVSRRKKHTHRPQKVTALAQRKLDPRGVRTKQSREGV